MERRLDQGCGHKCTLSSVTCKQTLWELSAKSQTAILSNRHTVTFSESKDLKMP